MAINRVAYPTTPTPVSGDWAKIIDLMLTSYLKAQNALPIDYDNDNVLKGAVFNVGGTIYLADSDTAITGTPSSYVKITPAGATASAAYVANLTGVTWSDTYNGYYDGSGNLYIFDEMKAYFDGVISSVYLLSGGHAVDVESKINAYQKRMKVSYVAADGGSTSATTWTIMSLNTENYNQITGASLATNQITLPAGKYYVNGYSRFFVTDRSITRLQNVTDAATLVKSQVAFAENATNCSVSCHISGYFELAASKVIEWQYYVESARATNGLGIGGVVLGSEEHRGLTITKVVF